MTDAATLDILLHGSRIGTLARLDGDRSIFTFDEAYHANEDRATLSLACRVLYGGLAVIRFADAGIAVVAGPRSYCLNLP